MLSLCAVPPPLPLPLDPLQPANPAQMHANSSNVAAALPSRLPADSRPRRARNANNSVENMPSGSNGTLGRTRGFAKGINSDSAVVSVALQEAPMGPTAPADAHVIALPSAVDPFMNCTVPLGPALLLLLDETVAVRVTLPPDVMLVRLEATADVVVAFVIVTARVLLLALELKLLFASAV